MVTVSMAKLIQLLPASWSNSISKVIIGRSLQQYARIHVQGGEHLQGLQTPVIFICNHLSNSDALVLDKVLKQIDPTFVAGEKLSNNAVTGLGLNVIKTTTIKPNTADKEGLTNMIRLIKQGESLLIFPEGTRSRTGSLIEAKKGVLLVARMTGAPIVPIGLCGTEKLLPINLNGDMRTERFYPAEVFISIGQPFELPRRAPEQDKKGYDDSTIHMMMRKIAAILPEEYRGVYK
ncbi:lysophospholipid acyltransferase family protein [Paenibacillus mesotrionivorans]|uniref:Lysophospholipid acyltransferase family protein n=1 Tax=Paenibacillus mesotrionivorans TaxID=3160968 RepID=A0ACC7NZ06_9BACL